MKCTPPVVLLLSSFFMCYFDRKKLRRPESSDLKRRKVGKNYGYTPDHFLLIDPCKGYVYG